MGISVPTNPVTEGFILQVTKVATTSNTTLSGLGASVDGVTLSAGERVLLLGQSTGSQNGVWVAASGAWTRPHDYAAGSVLKSNIVVPVSSGSTNADTRWQITTDGNITVDTTSTTWGKTDLGLVAVVDDTSPQLGGNLDLNNKTVKNGAATVFSIDASANVTFENNVSISGTVNMPATTTLPNTGDGAITTEASAADADGKPLSLAAGSTTAGGTNDTGAGGSITLKPGAGKGSAVGGDVIIQTAPASSGGGATVINNYSTQMIVKESGNIGMGTTGPDRKLDILDASNPQLRLTHTDGSKYVDVSSTANSNAAVSFPGSTMQVQSAGSASFVQVQNSSTGTADGVGDGLSVGLNGKDAFIWNRESTGSPTLKLGVGGVTSALEINVSNEVTATNNVSVVTGVLNYKTETIVDNGSTGTTLAKANSASITVLTDSGNGGKVILPAADTEGLTYVVASGINGAQTGITIDTSANPADRFYTSTANGVTADQGLTAYQSKTCICIAANKWLVIG